MSQVISKVIRSSSALTVVLLFAILLVYRLGNIDRREISWDVLGYYLYLPASTIYHDPLLKDPSWLRQINEEKNLSGTLYQISTNDQGEPIYFFLMGMAWLYLPFFLLAHFLATTLAYPADGFSTPYQVVLVAGCLIYTFIGMIFFRKILLKYLPEHIASIVLIVIYLGTNAVHHLSLKNLETVNVLFTLACILTWLTIRWYEQAQFKLMTGIAICAALLILVKPSEIFILLIPLLWNFDGWKNRIVLFWQYRMHLLVAFIAGIILLLPQISYWYLRTGHFIYDSYKNPGIGLDWLRPHIVPMLFSLRKGWIVYTPVMIFALAGWFFMWKHNRKVFVPAFTYFLITLYIVSSWTEWWYGASFSIRPLIVAYPFLGLSLGYLIQFISEKNRLTKISFTAIISLLILFNLFQYYQFRIGILDPYRTSPAYYQAVFLKTSVPEGAEKFLLLNRDFSGQDKFENPGAYQAYEWEYTDFQHDTTQNIVIDSSGNHFFRINEGEEFALVSTSPYKDLSRKDHIWLRIEFDACFPEKVPDSAPLFVTTMERKEGAYGYRSHEVKSDSLDRNWKHFTVEYLSPEIRSMHDAFKCYFWNRSGALFDIDNFRITVFEKR